MVICTEFIRLDFTEEVVKFFIGTSVDTLMIQTLQTELILQNGIFFQALPIATLSTGGSIRWFICSSMRFRFHPASLLSA